MSACGAPYGAPTRVVIPSGSSMASAADSLAAEADFFAIGTNDLIQYTLAIDRSDDAVATSVRAADQRVLRAVRKAFHDYGFDDDEADLRASATFAAGIGFLHLSGATPDARHGARSERFLDLMLRD